MRRTTRTWWMIVGLAVLSLAAPAMAYHHPSAGRWVQRDPGPSEATELTDDARLIAENVPEELPSAIRALEIRGHKALPGHADRLVAPVATIAALNADLGGSGLTTALSRVGHIRLAPEYKDGMNLYLYATGSPLCMVDPNGTDIYRKRGNNTWNPVNNAVHESVCVDTTLTGEDKGKNLACFSFGWDVPYLTWATPGRWLGWWFPPKPVFGFAMKGVIYEAPNVGTVVKRKATSCEQDGKWLRWMRSRREGSVDVYSPLVHNCVTYSNQEYDDAPGQH